MTKATLVPLWRDLPSNAYWVCFGPAGWIGWSSIGSTGSHATFGISSPSGWNHRRTAESVRRLCYTRPT